MSTVNDGNGIGSRVQSLLPRSRALQVGIALSFVFLLVGWFLTTGAVATMMGVWGVTLLLASIVGYATNWLWYSRGK